MKTAFVALTIALAMPAAWSQTTAPKLSSARDLERYVGTFPCRNGLLESKVLLHSLKTILKTDYAAYREHMSFSGCGAKEIRLLADGCFPTACRRLHVADLCEAY